MHQGYELLAAEDSIVDVPAVLRAWSKDPVVCSWLLDAFWCRALTEDPDLAAASLFAYPPQRR